jgi:putative FmdB family regulatory protein
MPTYDYRCEKCGHEFELFQNISESPKRKCPECGKLSLKRLFGTGAAVVFKGSGFYQTDYRSESYKKAADQYKKSTYTKTVGMWYSGSVFKSYNKPAKPVANKNDSKKKKD